MFISNYHAHSLYSDGSSHLEEYVQAAIRKGISSLGFSCHAPVPEAFSAIWHMKKNEFPRYLREIKMLKKKYASTIEIYAGLEVDFIPSVVHPGDYQDTVDYLIGSVHFLGSFDKSTPFIFDESKEVFDKGLREVFQGDIKKLVSAYYDNIRKMIQKNPPDIIGHLDLVKKWNKNNTYFSENEDWYKNEIEQTLSSLQHTKCILEINTRGHYCNITENFYPSDWIIKEMRMKDIPVTIDSDAHHPEELTNHFEEARKILKEAGYRKMTALKNNRWVPMPL